MKPFRFISSLACSRGGRPSGCVLGQVKANATAAEVGLYSGRDRQQRLLEGAKKEKELTSTPRRSPTTWERWSAPTEEIRSEGQRVARKLGEGAAARVAEARANRNTVDVVETNGPEMESLHREKVLQQSSRRTSRSYSASDPPSRRVGGTRLNVFVQAYNTNAVKRRSCRRPGKTARPEVKGRLGIEQEDSDWLAGMFDEIGEARARNSSRRSSRKTACRCARGTRCSRSSSCRARCRSP